jgi:hypothetical protein
MFRNTVVVIALVAVFAAACLFSVAAIVRAKRPAARGDAAGSAMSAAVLVAVGLGWAPIAPLPLAAVLTVAFLWFAGRTALHLTKTSADSDAGDGLGPSAYHAVLALLGGWVLFAAARGTNSATDHPGHELGVLLVDTLAAAMMVFASAGWLLATFSPRAESGPNPIAKRSGIREALVAAGMALALYAVS